ncbi:hypothetical protein MUP00_03595 [Candidatus Bathyarchaeota archaeon]|nr:hypothetical protein [Candidatus Bathyarchaeota archaeon]
MARNRVIMEVVEIKGRCPVYKVGDRIVVDPVPGEDASVINLKETDNICTRVLGTALLSYTLWFEYASPSKGDGDKVPWQRALGPDYSKCPMVGPPYSKCGYVTFRASGVPSEGSGE